MPDPDKLVDLTQTATEFEASAIVDALRARQIAANSLGGGLAGFRAETPTLVRVVVRAADLARARVALTQIQHESIEVDWDQVDVGEPEHGTPPAPAPPHPPFAGEAPGPRPGGLARLRRAAPVIAGVLALLLGGVVFRVPPIFLLGLAGLTLTLIAWAIAEQLIGTGGTGRAGRDGSG